MAMQPLQSATRLTASQLEQLNTPSVSDTQPDDGAEVVLNLQAEMQNAAEELADLVSTFGRFARMSKKAESSEADPLAALLDEAKEEKLENLIRFVGKIKLNDAGLLTFARSLFPNDSDLMMALKELLLYRRLNELQKKKVREAIAELEKFADRAAMQSGINVAPMAKRFAQGQAMTPAELRDCYLRFVGDDMPACWFYKEWIDRFGIERRRRVLAFMLRALAADMLSSDPGIHFEEFGPLSASLTDARIIHTLDQQVVDTVSGFNFLTRREAIQASPDESQWVTLYLDGLMEVDTFPEKLAQFSASWLQDLLIKQRGQVINALQQIYHQSPEEIFADPRLKEMLQQKLAELMTALYQKERNSGLWKDYYR